MEKVTRNTTGGGWATVSLLNTNIKKTFKECPLGSPELRVQSLPAGGAVSVPGLRN